MLYWTLPAVLLALVFSRIDWAELARTARATTPWLVLLGLTYYPTVIVLGAVRWRASLRLASGQAPPVRFAVKHYWIGLAVGYFAPASVGWDIYRVVAGGRRVEGYVPAAAAVVLEKLVAFAVIMTMVVLLYPLAARFAQRDRGPIDSAHLVACWALAALVAALVLAAVLGRHRAVRSAADWLAERARRIAARIAPNHVPAAGNGRTLALLAPGRWNAALARGLLSLALLSAGIQTLAAAGNHLFFRAAGHHVPFAVNWFLTPLFFLIFILPISFGSLGIREGVFVLFYGLFGVPAETALLVSFINLCGILLNQAIGGSLIWLCRPGIPRNAFPGAGHAAGAHANHMRESADDHPSPGSLPNETPASCANDNVLQSPEP